MSDEPIATVTMTIKIDSLSGGRVGFGVFTQGTGGMTEEGAACTAALVATVQDFCDMNEFPVNVTRSAQ